MVSANAWRGGNPGGGRVDWLCALSGIGARRVGGCGWIEFRAVSSIGSVRERAAVMHYLDALESAYHEEELVIEPSKAAEA